MPTIRTLAAESLIELPRIKGSRFVAMAVPVADEAAAAEQIERMKTRWPDASHHCWAWRLNHENTRSFDDGEPRGTAGEPILRRIGGAELDGVLVVVMRWFGGTKLGTGGLVRAYGGAAAEALAEAEITTQEITERVGLRFPYELDGVVRSVLVAHSLEATESAYGVDIELTLAVPTEQVAAVLDDLGERGCGRIELSTDSTVG